MKGRLLRENDRGSDPGAVATVLAIKAGAAAGTPAPQPNLNLGSAEKLREIQSITDAALSRLAPQVLIEELVERIRQALTADTAAVLLLDPSGGHLVATRVSRAGSPPTASR
jgi:hypothetical protein